MIEYKDKSVKDMAKVFKKHGVRIPRRIRLNALKEVFKDLHKEELARLKKEMSKGGSVPVTVYSRFHRLKDYKSLSEFQLENEFSNYKDPALKNKYFKMLWTKVEEYLLLQETGKQVIKDLNSIEKKTSDTKDLILEYNRALDPYFYCKEGYLDGVPIESAVEHFVVSSGKKELYDLGIKYGIEVPKYRTKQDLQNIALKEFKNIQKLTDKRKEKIKEANISELKEMLSNLDKGVKMHVTKEEIIQKIITEIEERRSSIQPEMESEKIVDKPVVEPITPVNVPEDQNATHLYYQQIIKNQERIIELLQGPDDKEIKTKFNMEKIYNIVVVVLIVIVSIIWIIYGFTTLL